MSPSEANISLTASASATGGYVLPYQQKPQNQSDDHKNEEDDKQPHNLINDTSSVKFNKCIISFSTASVSVHSSYSVQTEIHFCRWERMDLIVPQWLVSHPKGRESYEFPFLHVLLSRQRSPWNQAGCLCHPSILCLSKTCEEVIPPNQLWLVISNWIEEKKQNVSSWIWKHIYFVWQAPGEI